MNGSSLFALPDAAAPLTVLAYMSGAESCLPITVLPIPGLGELTKQEHATPRIFVAHRGRGRRWYQLGGRTRELYTAPRMIEMYEKGLTFDHCRWEGESGRCVLVELADEHVQAATHGEIRSLGIRTQHELFDPRISDVALTLADEALNGRPNGLLYTQGLCMALIGGLANRDDAVERGQQSSSCRPLDPMKQKQLIDCIQEQLGADLSLTRISDEVGLSPYHFLRVFKATFGTTPRKFVQERRLDAAAEALRRGGRRSIADIAIEHGFASQSHMTELMRVRFGVTPSALRRSAGIDPPGQNLFAG